VFESNTESMMVANTGLSAKMPAALVISALLPRKTQRLRERVAGEKETRVTPNSDRAAVNNATGTSSSPTGGGGGEAGNSNPSAPDLERRCAAPSLPPAEPGRP
jgi:hypothetical protein